MILMRRGVAGETGGPADAITARLDHRLILEARARRPAVGEELAAALRSVGDDQRLIAVVVMLAGTKLLIRNEERKQRLVRSVTAAADRDVVLRRTEDVALRLRLRVPRAGPVAGFARDAGIGERRRPRAGIRVIANIHARRMTLQTFLVHRPLEVGPEVGMIGADSPLLGL